MKNANEVSYIKTQQLAFKEHLGWGAGREAYLSGCGNCTPSPKPCPDNASSIWLFRVVSFYNKLAI